MAAALVALAAFAVGVGVLRCLVVRAASRRRNDERWGLESTQEFENFGRHLRSMCEHEPHRQRALRAAGFSRDPHSGRLP